MDTLTLSCVLILSLGGSTIIDDVDAQEKIGCVWTQDGGVIDLSPLGNTDGTARFKDVKGDQGTQDWFYSWNPCFPFTEDPTQCSQVAVCQTDNGGLYFNCGNPAPVTTTTDNGYPAIVYKASTDIDRTSTIALICDESADSPIFEALGDLNNGDYHFKLTSVHACPGSGEDETSGLSIGSILLIVVLVLMTVYLFMGVVYNKARHQKTGVELIPNNMFWRAMPGAIANGFKFTFGLCRGKQASYDKV